MLQGSINQFKFVITTDRLHLRPFTDRDLGILTSLHANPEVAKTTIDGMQTREQVQGHLDGFISHQERYGYSQFAVFEKDTKKFIGRAGLTNRALNDEIGEQTEIRFAFLPEFWGKGYASELTAFLIKFAFEALGLDLVTASSGTQNPASFRVLTKNGLKFIKTIIPCGYGKDELVNYYLITRQEFLNKKS